MVLLHGFGATLFTWRLLLPFLSSSFTVSRLDLLGCGGSEKPTDGDYSIRGHSLLLERLLSERQLHGVTLVGHSFGGAIALYTALRLQGTGRIRKLVLIDAPAYRQRVPFFIQALRSPLGPAITRLVPPRIQVKAVLQLAYYEDRLVSAESVRAYAAALTTEGGRHALVRTARELIPEDIDQIAAQYPQLTTPTQIVWGDHDTIVPLSTGQRLARELPHATLRVIPGSGHLPHEERPVETIDALRGFLSA
jgi:pimeloyl-ACP methyl ester carboxylesterase